MSLREMDLCIVCKKRGKKEYSLFCSTCLNSTSFETRLKVFQKSKEFRTGHLGTPLNKGRLLTKEERENDNRQR